MFAAVCNGESAERVPVVKHQITHIKKSLVGALDIRIPITEKQKAVMAFSMAMAYTFLQAYHGIHYSHDSKIYLLFSQTISDNFDFDRPESYAPLYFWTLALIRLLGFDAISAIHISWLLYYLVIVYSFYLVSGSILVSALGLFFISSSMVTGLLFRYVWTELGYSALLTLLCATAFLLISDKACKGELVFLLALALLPLQRYIGAYLSVYVGFIYVVSQYGSGNIVKNFLRVLIAFSPAMIIYCWNFLLSNNISGPRIRVNTEYTLVMNEALSVIVRDFFAHWVTWVILTVIFWLRMIASKRSANKNIIFVALLMLVPMVQLAAQIHSNSVLAIDQMNPRYLIILTPVFFLALAITVNTIIPSRNTVFTVVGAIVIAAFSFSTSDVSRFNFFWRTLDVEFVGTKAELGYLQPSRVGIYVDKTGHPTMNNFMASDFILAKKILPNRMCKKYVVQGDFRLMEPIVYLPDCQSLVGHSYEMILEEGNAKHYDVLLIYKDRLASDWQEKLGLKANISFIHDAGPFFVVKRQPSAI